MRSYKKTCQINAIFWNVPKYDKRNRAIHTVSSYIGLYNSWKIWIFLRINLLDIFQKKICFENSILKCKPLNLLFKCKSIGTFYTWKKFFLNTMFSKALCIYFVHLYIYSNLVAKLSTSKRRFGIWDLGYQTSVRQWKYENSTVSFEKTFLLLDSFE